MGGRLLQSLMTLAVCVVLAGCANRREPVGNQHLRQGSGVVLVSVSSLNTGTCFSYGVDLVIRRADSGKNEKFLYVDNEFVKSDFADRRGHVYAFPLPPGEYAFWMQSTQPDMRYVDGHVGETFFVKAGELKYVGDFWVQGCGNVRRGFRDHWGSVRGTFARVYPDLSLDTVRTELIREQ